MTKKRTEKPAGQWHAHSGDRQPDETSGKTVALITADGTQLIPRPANAVNWRTTGAKAPSQDRRVAQYRVTP